jgi:peptide/nickel transport system permease protein
MFKYLLRKLFYGLLVMFGVITLVFFLFQGFCDPARLIIGQRADAATQENIRKELSLDQPVFKQYLHYLNDISPLSYYAASEYDAK